LLSADVAAGWCSVFGGTDLSQLTVVCS
jgi:hypothetical protein